VSVYGSGEVSASRAANPARAVARRSLPQRIPWLWYDLVVSRVPLPLWLLSLLPFLFTYGVGVILASTAGELTHFLRDWRWLLTAFAGPTVASLSLGYVPRGVKRFWASLRPWLADAEEEIAAFNAGIPSLLTRFFWLCAPPLIAFIAMWAVLGPIPGNWSYDYAHPEVFNFFVLLTALVNGYFVGAAFSMIGIGLGLLTRRISDTLDLKRGFILHGGKAALQPFSQLLWMTWTAFALPVIAIFGLSLATTVMPAGGSLRFYNIITLLLLGVMIAPSIVVPQLFMNRLLARQKARELQALRQELEEAASTPESADTPDILRRIQRQQYLLYQIQKTEAFAPTLVDARFVLQIGTSVTGILLANVVLRTVIARFLQ